jgi:ATP-dependent DNA helicase RecG
MSIKASISVLDALFSHENLLQLGEEFDLEFKAAQGKKGEGTLPDNLWETYSAMANTEGGIIVLGVQQLSGTHTEIKGIKNTEKLRKTFWDAVNNKQIISANLLQNKDVKIEKWQGKNVLIINIPRASRQQKPIYKGLNPFSGTFRRNHEGDYKCDEATVKRMIAEASDEPRDNKLLSHFTLDDLEKESLAAYRNAFKSTSPTHPWIGLDDKEFLRNLGGWRIDRPTGEEGLTLAGILMFGKYGSLLEAIPHYNLDYQERAKNTSKERWLDRITLDGKWSGNLFDFYRRVYSKLAQDLKVPFRLEKAHKRVDESNVHEALREAFINTLIHADYSGTTSTVIIKQPDIFIFENAGGLRVPISLIITGGTSDCRNPCLQKMFQHIGASDKAGSGFPKILRAWKEMHWRHPLLEENFQPERTVLKLAMLSLLPQQTIDMLSQRFGDKFKKLEEIDRLILVTAAIEGKASHHRLSGITNEHSRDLTFRFRKLVDNGLLISDGFGRGTTYHLPEANQTEHELLTQKLSHDELQLLKTIKERRKTPKADIEQMILIICRARFVTPKEIAELIDREVNTLRTHYLGRLVGSKKLQLKFPDKPNHKDQAYKTLK